MYLQLINILCKHFSRKHDHELVLSLIEQYLSTCDSRPLGQNGEQILSDLIKFKHEKTGDNLIINAARVGNLDLIETLNEQSPLNFNYSNKDGKNALHEACQNSQVECVKYLIEVGKIEVNALRKGDWTPLMLACTRDNVEIIKYLVEHEADINQVNKDGWNAFQIAVREGHLIIIEYLMTVNPGLAYGFKTKNGRTPLHTACLHGHLDILKLFVAKLDSTRLRVCLDAVDSCGNTPFSECVLADHLKIVEYVMTSLRSFVDLSHRDSLQNSFIHLMAQSGSISCLKYLFGMFYCEVNDKLELVDKFSQDLNRFKMTPLHSACKNNKPEIVEYLLERLGKEAGSERIRELINQKDEHDRSSLDIVKSARCHQILDMFNKFQAF